MLPTYHTYESFLVLVYQAESDIFYIHLIGIEIWCYSIVHRQFADSLHIRGTDARVRKINKQIIQEVFSWMLGARY